MKKLLNVLMITVFSFFLINTASAQYDPIAALDEILSVQLQMAKILKTIHTLKDFKVKAPIIFKLQVKNKNLTHQSLAAILKMPIEKQREYLKKSSLLRTKNAATAQEALKEMKRIEAIPGVKAELEKLEKTFSNQGYKNKSLEITRMYIKLHKNVNPQGAPAQPR